MNYNLYVEDKDLDDVVDVLPTCVVQKKVLRLLLKHQVKQRSEEWYITRKSCLTASDAATALGQNPYKKPSELIKSKSGFYSNAQPDPNMIRATEHGIKYEDEAAAAYGVLRPDLLPFFELGLVMHEKHRFLGASPDRITKDGILIEIKVRLLFILFLSLLDVLFYQNAYFRQKFPRCSYLLNKTL